MRKIYKTLIPLALLCIMITCIPTFSTSKADDDDDWYKKLQEYIQEYANGDFDEEIEKKKKEKEEEEERWAEAAEEYNEYTVENGYPKGMHDWYNRYHLADWTDEDWATAKLMLQAEYCKDNNCDLISPSLDDIGGKFGDFAAYKEDNYFILRVAIPYDAYGNIHFDTIDFTPITVSKEGTSYLDEVLKNYDKEYPTCYMYTGFGSDPKFVSRDSYPHLKISSDMIVITRYQSTGNTDAVFNDQWMDDRVYSKEADEFILRLPSNLAFAFTKYVNFDRFDYCWLCKNSANMPPAKNLKLNHKKKTLSKEKAQVYTINEVVKKSNDFAAKNPKYKKFVDWSITPLELYLLKLEFTEE